MIDLWQAVFLAVLQGLTEFLPISSSAHLVIPSLLFDWPDQGLAFDVAVHVGTLAAVVLYYRRDLLLMASAWFASLRNPTSACEESRLVWYLIAATIPAGLVGVFGGHFIEQHLRTLPVIAATTLLFGLLLGVADRRVPRSPRPEAANSQPSRLLTLPLALAVGTAQAFAPVPGVSRSGVTITAGLLLGMSRQAAARFSFLLSIPIIASAGALHLSRLMLGDIPVDWTLLVVGVVLSGLTAYACIATFLRLLDRVGLMPFVYYRIVLAACLIGIWVAQN